MCCHQYSQSKIIAHALKQAKYLICVLGIQATSGLIGKDQFGGIDERPGDCHALPFAA